MFLFNLKQITDRIESKEERLNAIYDYVKYKMTWNGKYGYYTKKGVETAYYDNSGNVAEINLILTSMLRMAGLDANPVLLSTRDNGVALFPNRSKFNYVITCVNLDGKQILLDATEKYASKICLPIRDLNDKGRLIRKDGSSEEINLIPKFNSIKLTNVLATIDALGMLSGQIRHNHADYNALLFRKKYLEISKDSYLEKLEGNYAGLEVENYEIKNEKTISEPIIESYDFKKSNAIEVIGNKMFITPLLFFAMSQNPFKQENRQYPIDFAFPSKDKYQIVLTIPDGYEVESLPKSINVSTIHKITNYDFLISTSNKQITISMNLGINDSFVASDYYSQLKEFFKLVVDKQNEKIVLKKT